MYVLSHVMKDFSWYQVQSHQSIQCRPDFRKICSLVWPLKSVVFSSTHLNDLKLGQCLDRDDIILSTIFGESTWPSSHFTACFVFYRQAFYRLVYQIINLRDIDLQHLGGISDVKVGTIVDSNRAAWEISLKVIFVTLHISRPIKVVCLLYLFVFPVFPIRTGNKAVSFY